MFLVVILAEYQDLWQVSPRPHDKETQLQPEQPAVASDPVSRLPTACLPPVTEELQQWTLLYVIQGLS